MTIFIAKEAPVIVQTLLQVFQLVILLYRIYIFLHKAVRQLVLLGKKRIFFSTLLFKLCHSLLQSSFSLKKN